MARIAVIGAGKIGGTLGSAWQRAGHDVTFGVREPMDRDAGSDQRFGTPEDAIRAAEAVVFAVPGAAMDATVPDLERALRGKVIVDATNRVGHTPAHSAALQKIATETTPVYRAFNSLGFENFRDPHYGSDVADLFYAGPDGPGRMLVETLISDIGLRPIYVGDDPEIVDNVLRLWFALSSGQKMGRGVAFKVLRR
jgi:8-hydroxy-5-deazaflavin:NADPH oxidoreductase